MTFELRDEPWVRKHDLPAHALTAPRIVYPTTLAELIEVCRDTPHDQPMHAAGSHWGLSTAAMSDYTFVETRDPRNQRPAMARTLTEVIPGCMNYEFLRAMAARHPPSFEQNVADTTPYYVHIETGKRVYELYAELDQNALADPAGLAADLRDHHSNGEYGGPWAFRTLGSAGGQTVFGALTTGTHGGDFQDPPIADDVVAMHLVTGGGRHYWIEPELDIGQATLTDDAKLHALYGPLGGFEVVRDTNVFNAVLVGGHRFGVVYSIVLQARRQYMMRETRVLDTWQSVRGQIATLNGPLYRSPASNKFLQIVVCLTPFGGFQQNLVGITKRSNAPFTSQPPLGRLARVGARLPQADPLTGNPVFERAGNSATLPPDHTDPAKAPAGGFLERACSNGVFLEGVLENVINQVRNFITDPGVVPPTVAAVAVATGGAGLLALLTALAVIVEVLAALLVDLSAAAGDKRFGQTLDRVKNALLDQPDPATRAAGLFVWQMIGYKVFLSQQGPIDYTAISYAIMDTHDYHDRSCNLNVDSIEVFFAADDPMLIAFVDALIAFEIRQEWAGKALVGYASLRFLGRSRALLGPARWRRTCVVEVAGLRDVDGSSALIDFALSLSRNPQFGGVLHWGQRNPSSRLDIERRFGDANDPHNGDLGRWREALRRIVGESKLFSSEFTRQTGLEP